MTLCKGTGCLIKTQCKRYTTAPGVCQSWFFTSPVVFSADKKKMTCGMYWGDNTQWIMDKLIENDTI